MHQDTFSAECSIHVCFFSRATRSLNCLDREVSCFQQPVRCLLSIMSQYRVKASRLWTGCRLALSWGETTYSRSFSALPWWCWTGPCSYEFRSGLFMSHSGSHFSSSSLFWLLSHIYSLVQYIPSPLITTACFDRPCQTCSRKRLCRDVCPGSPPSTSGSMSVLATK